MAIPKLFTLWFTALLHPRETFKREKANASIKNAIMHIFLSGLVSAALMTYVVLIFMKAFWGGVSDLSGLSNLFLFVVLVAPMSLILSILTGSAILFFIAKAFKGKGSYIIQTYLISIFASPLFVISSLFSLAYWLVWSVQTSPNPPGSFMVLLNTVFEILLGAYSLYLTVLALKETHK
jgi:hypothetical protein